MISAIIDIGSGSVGVTLVETGKDKVPVIRYSARKDVVIFGDLTPKRLLDASLVVLSEVIADLQKAKVSPPAEIFCFLSSHLTASQTITIKADLGKPTKISDQLISDLVDKEFANIKNETVIERKIMQVRLNGYEVADLRDKIAREAEVSVFYTISSAPIVKSIKDVIAGLFHNDRIEFHSFSFAYFSALRDIFKNEHDFIFADIGSEITDVNMVKAGVLVRSVTFPQGKNGIIRSMSAGGSKNTALKAAMIRRHSEGAVSKEIKPAILNDIASALTKWNKEMLDVFGGFDTEYVRPNKIFILADKNVSDIIKQQLKVNGESDVKDITSADLNKICDNRSGAADDPFLMIAAIFVNKLLY